MHKGIIGWSLWLLASQPGASQTEPVWPGPQPVSGALAPAALAATDAYGRNPKAIEAQLVPKAPDAIESIIQRVPICIAWNKSWAGELGKSILFRVKSLGARSFRVGYFAYWTTERPWGDNRLSRWLLPALAIDAFYSHLFFVFPGVQAALYGPGDIEGVRVTYQMGDDGRLEPVTLFADDETHREVALDVSEAIDENRRVVLLNDTWSHQLAGRRAAAAIRAGAAHQCFSGASVQPLTEQLAHTFRLGSPNNARRARPAWKI